MAIGSRALPAGFVATATTQSIPFAAMAMKSAASMACSFIPKSPTPPRVRGFWKDSFARSAAVTLSGASATSSKTQSSVSVRRSESGKVLLGLSGGVDSSVVAALLHRAIGDQLVCVFVDTGLLRLGEGDQVMSTFAQHLGVRSSASTPKQRFLSALAGVTDPEQKRKIIGRTFIEVFDEEAHKLTGVGFPRAGHDLSGRHRVRWLAHR